MRRLTSTGRVFPRAAGLLVLLLAACTSVPATSVRQGPSPGSSAPTVTVSAIDSSFGPDITVAAGTKVVFVNNGSLKHTASHGTNGQLAEDFLFDLTLEPGATDSYTFDTAGSYPVTCIVHPTMNMTITVE